MDNWTHKIFLLVDRSWVDLGIWTYFEKNYTYGNIRYVEIPTVGRSTRMHFIYQNLDNIYWHVEAEFRNSG